MSLTNYGKNKTKTQFSPWPRGAAIYFETEGYWNAFKSILGYSSQSESILD